MTRKSLRTSRRLRAAEGKEKFTPAPLSTYRIDIDRGLQRGIIVFTLAAAAFSALYFDTLRDQPGHLFRPRVLGGGMLVVGAVAFLGVFLHHHRRGLLRSKSRLAVFGGLCLIPLLTARAVALGGASANLVPLGVIAFIISLCHGTGVAVATSFVLAFLVAVGLRSEQFPIVHPAALMLLGGAFVWAFGAKRIRKRLWLFKVGFVAGFVQLWLATGTDLVVLGELSKEGGWAALNGLATGALLTALLPIIEYLFGVNTEISLLELSDLNQPLLRQLGLEAPGTYHHSLIVGSLAETASEAIGADSLLARVGAYFHDIGKLEKPDYFVENEGSQGSRHDQLSPSMSALIISAHVKDGVEIAEEYNLPRAVVDIIEQHHGTSLIEFFYQRSQEANGDEAPSEDAFRYPGPRPTTREAAIILLADAVEAASRTLPEPSPKRLQILVHKLVMKKLLDGQLDDSPLTFADLARAEKSFVRVLTAIFHSRVRYPAVAIDEEGQSEEGAAAGERRTESPR